MKKNFLFFFIVFLAASIFILTAVPLQLFADTSYSVNPVYPGTPLRDAINAALSNGDPVDYIYLSPGTYTENWILINVGAGNVLNIIGSNPSTTIIDAGNTDAPFYLSGGGTIRISGLTITNGNRTWGGALRIDGMNNVEVDNCIIFNNRDSAIYTGSSNLTITNSIIRNNFGGNGSAFYNYDGGGNLTIHNCKIYDNTGSGMGSTLISWSGTVEASQNWWGTPNPDFLDTNFVYVMPNNLSSFFEPYYIDEAMTILSNDINSSSGSRPLTPEDWVLMDLSIDGLLAHYGPNTEGFVKTLYDNILGRIPDKDGLNYWNTQLTNNLFTADQIIEHFIFSDELGSKIEAMTNDEFVNFLYDAILARTPDTEGYNQWLAFMADGNSKLDTLRAFLNNEEWIKICSMFNVTP